MDKELLTLQVGKSIGYYRKMNGIKLVDLANHIGTSATFLSRVEHGEKLPSVLALYSISKALKVSCDSLLNGPEEESNVQNIISLLHGKSKAELAGLEKLICVWNEEISN